MDTTTILLGNAVSFVGEACGIVSGIHKSRTLWWFSARLIVAGIASAILGAWLALWLNCTSVARNLVMHRSGALSMPMRLAMSAAMLLGLLMLRPGAGMAQHAAEVMAIAACVAFTMLMRSSDEHLKWLTFVTTFPWLVYNCYILNFVGAVFCALSMAANLAGVLRIRAHSQRPALDAVAST